MNYYIKEIQKADGAQRTAGVKARDDVNDILSLMKVNEIEVILEKTTSVWSKIKKQFKSIQVWDKATKNLKKNDVLIVQFPVVEHSIFLYKVFRKLRKRGISIVLLVHDLDILRRAKRKDISLIKRKINSLEEEMIPQESDCLIVHNEKMIKYMEKLGYEKEKLISLQIFDYLIANYDHEKIKKRKIEKEGPIIVAGSLRPHKAQYLYKFSNRIKANLFGVGYCGKEDENIKYFGSFMPDELPYALQGSFGLVWDGEVVDTCSGIYGEYLKINNPHKTSLYLAAGIPVVIWKKAALASFIEKNKCGILVDSIEQIPDIIHKMTQDEYLELKKNAEKIGEKLRNGEFLCTAVKKALNYIEEKNEK